MAKNNQFTENGGNFMTKFTRKIIVSIIALAALTNTSLAVSAQTTQSDFTEIMTESSVHIPLLAQGYQSLKEINEALDFRDLKDEEDEASTVEEVLEIADEVMGQEGEVVDLSLAEQLITYSVVSDEVFPDGTFTEGDNYTKDIDVGFYFFEGKLIGSIATSANFSVEDSMYLKAEEVVTWVDDAATVSDIELPDGSVFSYSTLESEGEYYSAVIVSTEDQSGVASFDNLTFKGDVVLESPYFYMDEFKSSFLDINLFNLILTVSPEYFEVEESESVEETENVESETE